jgi:uncharacterized membrane protein YjfL (UPF0719 family)
MGELILQTLAYGAVGIAILAVGFYVTDFLTQGHLATQTTDPHTPGAAVVVAADWVSLGLIMFFAIYFSGGGWSGLDDVAVFGCIGVLLQAVGFLVLDRLTPGKLGDICSHDFVHPAVWAAAGADFGIAFIVCAALT